MSECLIQAARRANRQFKDFMKQSGQALPLYRSITPEDLNPHFQFEIVEATLD